MAWLEFWGAYNNTGPYANVVVGGSPNSVGPYGAPLDTAHSQGYGYGIEFTDDGNYGVTFHLNLVPFAVNDNEQYVANNYYVDYGSDYRYRLTIHISKDNQASWSQIYNNFIFSHPSTGPLLYRNGWQTTAASSQWTQSFQLPRGTTHVRIELSGEEATLFHSNIFTIQQVIPNFKPWALRKNGRCRSLNNLPNGRFLIRKNGTWQDKSIQSASDVGQVNKGKNRIRKSGKWVGQAQVGE